MNPPAPGRLNAANDKDWVRLLDEPLEKCKWKAEYDGNPQTAPEQWPDVTLSLQEPQYVERIRYMVKHADNVVKPSHKYELYVWNNGYWKKIWNATAEKEHFQINGLSCGKLYWLHCKDQGTEELPFFIDSQGKQIFPYDDLLNTLYVKLQ